MASKRVRSHPHLYEISAWPWLERLSRTAGTRVTLGTVPAAEWDRLAASGFDFVYLMGVWRRSAIGRLIARTDPGLLAAYDRVLPGWQMRDVPGSPYCIQAYEPDARMGGWEGLDAARKALAQRGVGLILDFVPNHTGFDHEWIATRPDLYVRGTLDHLREQPDFFRAVDAGDELHVFACGRDPYFPAWRDVAQLNYFNPETREAMMAVLETLAQHCDGVRCDMAMLVVNDVFEQTWGGILNPAWRQPAAEFWPEATRRGAPLLFLGEVYWDRELQLQQQGFHFTYDKRLLDRLHDGAVAAIRGHLAADAEYNERLARFLENHDEERAASVFGARLPAAAAIALTLPGMRFFYDGQLDGARIKAPVQLGRWPTETPDEYASGMHRRLMAFINAPVLHDGAWTTLPVLSGGSPLVASAWRREAELAVVVANLSPDASEGRIDLGVLPPGSAFVFDDQLSGRQFRWTRAELERGLPVWLDGGHAHLFLVSATAAHDA